MKDKYTFRNELLEKNDSFRELFYKLQDERKITEFDQRINDIIESDKTPIHFFDKEIFFSDIFEMGENSGRCFQCSIELSFLLEKHGYNTSLIQGKNPYFVGTIGSLNGGHYWIKVNIDNKTCYVDTSLLAIIQPEAIKELGYEKVEEYSVEQLKKMPQYERYYDGMVVDGGFQP